MQTAAKISLVLTDPSSFKRFTDIQREIRYGRFYQRLASELVKAIHTKQALGDLGERVVALAEKSYAFRQKDSLEHASQVLINAALPQQYEIIGRYYQALRLQGFGRGDVEQAACLLERVSETGPLRYRARAMQSLGSNSFHKGDYQAALSYYYEAARFASSGSIYDAYATLGTQKMVAVIKSEDGNHRGALALLENLFPLAHAMRSSQPHVYYDYLNSLALELCEVGRLEEANTVSQIALASPFAHAYPEWRETREEIELRGWRASRSTVVLSQRTPEIGNLVCLPVPEHQGSASPADSIPAAPTQTARVLCYLDWKKKKMPKQSNGDPDDKTTPRPITGKEKQARLTEVAKLTTREMLLRLMKTLGDEDISDDQLRRALIILEGLDPDEDQGS